MTGVSQINTNIAQDEIQKQDKLFVVSNNPVVDAGVWGGIGAASGAIAQTIMEKRLINNKDLLDSRIKELEKDIFEKTKSDKVLNNAKKALEVYKKGKINFGNIGRLALFMGALSFIPSLLIDSIIWSSKKHDKTNEK